MAAFGIWGILPIYWKRLLEISPYEIVSNRVVWTCLFTGFLILFLKKKRLLKSVLRNRKQVWLILACALLLGVNWLTYIYAVNSGHVLDASMGYYINPLISVFLGILLLKERVSSIQKMAIFLAMIGVFLVVFEYGKIPWISLVLAFTFGFYGLFKKISGVDPIIG
jgi:chloramphenicol-sensitive protein RarD